MFDFRTRLYFWLNNKINKLTMNNNYENLKYEKNEK